MFSRLDEELAAALVEKVGGDHRRGVRHCAPATLKRAARRMSTPISMNRRDPDWPIDPILRRAPAGRRGRPDRQHPQLRLPRDGPERREPDALRRVPGRCLPPPPGADRRALRLPQRRLRRTSTRSGSSRTSTASSASGRSSAGRRCASIGEMRTLGPGQRVHNIRWDEFPEKPVARPDRRAAAARRPARRSTMPMRAFRPDEEYAARHRSWRRRQRALPGGSARAPRGDGPASPAPRASAGPAPGPASRARRRSARRCRRSRSARGWRCWRCPASSSSRRARRSGEGDRARRRPAHRLLRERLRRLRRPARRLRSRAATSPASRSARRRRRV